MIQCQTCKVHLAVVFSPMGNHCLSCASGFTIVNQHELDEQARIKHEYEEEIRLRAMNEYVSERDQLEHTARKLVNLYTESPVTNETYLEHAAAWSVDLRKIVDLRLTEHKHKQLLEENDSLEDSLQPLRDEMKTLTRAVQDLQNKEQLYEKKVANLTELAAKLSDMRGFNSDKAAWFHRRLSEVLKYEPTDYRRKLLFDRLVQEAEGKDP